MKTIFHAKRFDTLKASERAAYKALVAELKAEPGRGHCFGPVWDTGGAYASRIACDGQEIYLQTESTVGVHENQLNAIFSDGKSRRVFDLSDSSIGPQSNHVRTVTWFDLPPALVALRNSTLRCGYCGKDEAADSGKVFCDKCPGSEYLKPDDFKLLRLMPISFRGDRPEITEAERAAILPAYQAGRLALGARRKAAKVAQIAAQHENAERELEGFTFFWDRGVDTENLIYYGSTKGFCFGWRKPLTDAEAAEVLAVISEFRFRYEIKTTSGGLHNGRTLSGNE